MTNLIRLWRDGETSNIGVTETPGYDCVQYAAQDSILIPCDEWDRLYSEWAASDFMGSIYDYLQKAFADLDGDESDDQEDPDDNPPDDRGPDDYSIMLAMESADHLSPAARVDLLEQQISDDLLARGLLPINGGYFQMK